MKGKKSMDHMMSIIGAVIAVLLLSFLIIAGNPTTAHAAFMQTILSKLPFYHEKNDIPPAETLYMCKDGSKYFCVISDAEMTSKCNSKFEKKFDFRAADEWIDCENQACLKNYPDLTVQGYVMFIPVNSAWAEPPAQGISTTIISAIYDSSIRFYQPPGQVYSLVNCPSGSQLKKSVVGEACTIKGSPEGCYDEDEAINALLQCAAKWNLKPNTIIIGIDYTTFSLQQESCSPVNAYITDFAGQKQVILAAKEVVGAIPWNSIWSQSFLARTQCIEYNTVEPLSVKFPQCKQNLKIGG